MVTGVCGVHGVDVARIAIKENKKGQDTVYSDPTQDQSGKSHARESKTISSCATLENHVPVSIRVNIFFVRKKN